MKVALVTDGVWPYVLGGMQRHSYYLCKYLAKNGIYVDLYHYNQSAYDISKLEFFTEEEKKFIRSTIVSFPVSPRFPGHYLYNSYRYSKKVYKLAFPRMNEYDLVYAKGFAGWYFVTHKYRSPVPVGIKFHGYEMFQKAPGAYQRLQQVLLLRGPVKKLNHASDFVFSYGGKITDLILSLEVSPDKIIEIPSGVEESSVISHVRPAGKKRNFVFLGRYERRKGIEELNKAIKMCSPQVLAISEFHFIGPIPEHKKLSSNAVYHGEIRDKEKLKGLLAKADVLLCPSWSEGMPNVILEGMSNGLAVIATDVGATNIMVDDRTGWLIDSPEPPQIRKAIEAAATCADTELNTRKFNALQKVRENFTWEQIIQKFIAVLNALKGS